MSDLLKAVADANNLKHIRRTPNVTTNNRHKHILKSKENIFKQKCDKELKKKLRKYKLRRDGIEDQDILDVSQILVTSLRIKSPNKSDKVNKSPKVSCEYPKPNNYLFKMVRRRKTSTQVEKNNIDVSSAQNADTICTILFDDESQNNKMDAFKLMMDSRNKSIGSNSPGKEMNSNETLSKDLEEKKAIKAKRILSLRKMAESKGSLKKMELEDYREDCIKKKMLKRAEMFKDMILKQDVKVDKKEVSPKSKKSLQNLNCNDNVLYQENNIKQNNKTLKLCDIFCDTNTIIDETKPSELRVSDEDIEFLKKLSPSIRKKENMLSYFKKVSKDEEVVSEQIENKGSDEITSVIKVKFTPKRKKKTKILKCNEDVKEGMNKVKINVETRDLVSCDKNELEKSEDMENKERRKRKRNKKVEENLSSLAKDSRDSIDSLNNESRPKRNAKKPVKYIEDVHCFSSDEELHIFTPKKKRNSESYLKPKINETVHNVDTKKKTKENNSNIKRSVNLHMQSLSNSTETVNTITKPESRKELKNVKNFNGMSKSLNSTKVKKDNKLVKLAPIFVSKPHLSLEAIEAKQRFLKSGVPEKLKKNIVQQSSNTILLDNFYPVVHIHQNDSHINDYQGKDWYKATYTEIEEINIKNYLFKNFIMQVSEGNTNFPILQLKPENILKSIKSAYPKFPVYRTYHKLRSKSKGECKDFNDIDLDNSVEIIDGCTETNYDNPEKLNWCDKYKPTSSNQIIGNFESIKELKRWLETWSEKLTRDRNNGSDSSDMSDFYCSDVDSRDAMKNTNSILILTGPTGSGKTSSVYAVAAELAIKVIEVNASSKRNGKIMLQDLQEATQSHKVNRAKINTDSSQKSSQEVLILTNSKKRGRPKKAMDDSKTKKSNLTISSQTISQTPSSQECGRTGMSLILIDDADIVFDQDDGFCSAISQLIQSSKRPVILVTSSLSCPHLQRFCQNAKTIHMRPLLPKMLGTWLDIMCLADVGKCYMGLGEKLLDLYRGDIRKTINCLQFYMNSYKNTNQTDVLEDPMSQMIRNIDDENSSMSWVDSDNLDGPLYRDIASISSKIEKQRNLFPYINSLNVFNVWWSLIDNFNDLKNEDDMKIHKDKNKEIKGIVEILDKLSVIDSIDRIKPDQRNNIATKPWHCSETASLLETEDFEGYNEGYCVNKDISDVLIMSTIAEIDNLFKTEKSIPDFAPSMSTHRKKDRIVSQHHTLSSYLNPSAILDRRATALDYWSSCRTICRLEKSKTDYNVKRNNRFCHYLKSLNILCKNEFFDNLADSLN